MPQVNPYTIVLVVSAIISLLAAIIVFQRSAPGSRSLGGLLLAMFFWSSTYALTWASGNIETKTFWLKVMYLGVAATPTLFFLFTVRITRHDHWLSRLNLILLCIQPLTTILLVWGAEHLVFDQITLGWRGGFTVLHFKRGIWFWANVYYSYAIILAGYIVLAVSSIRANLIFRRQYLLVLGGSVAPFLFNIYTQMQFSSLHDLDLAPIAFGISGLVYAYTILRFQFMDLVPVARSTLIENMSDGVLVLDAQGRIVDANPAILTLVKDTAASILGKNISTIMYGWVEMNWVVNQDDATRTELRLQNDPSRYMDLRMTPLFNERHELTGRIIVFRDITDRKKVEKDLVRVNDHLNAQLLEIGTLQSQLREQAIRDALTNVFNRRYLEETLDRELARAEREGYPLCMIMMDIDHFKDVNDVYGHEAGDVVLKALSEMITLQSRHGDFACRYGGEEFMLVMPNIGLETTLKRALELHQNIEAFNIPYGRFNLSITISMGVACYPLHGETKEELLRAADKALYQSKHSGRNCVSVYQDHQPTTVLENYSNNS